MLLRPQNNRPRGDGPRDLLHDAITGHQNPNFPGRIIMALLRYFVAASLVLMLLCGVFPVRAQNAGATYVITYVEVSPSAYDAARALLRKFRGGARKEPGNAAFEVFQNIAQPRHFVLYETWQDAKAQDSHAAADASKQFRNELKPMLIAPYDERVHTAFAIGPSKPYGKRVIYVITHVDYAGAKKDAGLASIKQLSAGSVNDAGVLRYEVLEQAVKPNHLTLVEVWSSKAALEAHEQAEHTRKFRDELLPIGGSPFDEQFYRPLN
jgi:quinol monooxygenase YgiN